MKFSNRHENPKTSDNIVKLNLFVCSDNEESQKKRILIVCQSSLTQPGFELRQSIRKTWASKASKEFPVSIVFLFGTPKNLSAQTDLEKESEQFGDILQVSNENVFDL
jgi:hypothetical protein